MSKRGIGMQGLCTQRIWLSGLALALGIMGCGEVRRSPDLGPGPVILISVDTLRADHLNCYGYEERVTSPHIDALARDGILFEQHISASPWTTPAHMSLLTSLAPSSHGLTEPFARMLDPETAPGFNRLTEERLTLAELLREQGRSTAAFTAGAALDPAIGFDQGFERYDTSMYKLDDGNMARLMSWVDSHRELPFFLFWHNFEVHAPYLNDEFLAEELEPGNADRLSAVMSEMNAELGAAPPGVQERASMHERYGRALESHGALHRPVMAALYDGGIRSFDRRLGELIEGLKRSGLYDSSLIVLTSDHGEEFGEHGGGLYNAHGHSLYEELLHVPLIVKLPAGAHRGTRVSALVRSIDVMPTVLELLGIPQLGLGLQGSSLSPLWRTRAAAPERLALSEALAADAEKKGVRNEHFKYIVSISAETVSQRGRHFVPDPARDRELYDLRRDPGETRNLLDLPTSAELERTVSDLDASLRSMAATQRAEVQRTQLAPESVLRLRELGYIE